MHSPSAAQRPGTALLPGARALLVALCVAGTLSGPVGAAVDSSPSEDARTRHVRVPPWPEAGFAPSPGPVPAPASIAPDSSGVRGRLLYADRLVSIQGYTGATQTLPARGVVMDVRDQATGALLGTMATNPDGRFALRINALAVDAVLVLRGQAVTDAGDTLRVTGADGTLQGASVAGPIALEPGVDLDLGSLTAPDAPGAVAARLVNLLDLARSAVDWVGRDRGSWPGGLPGLRYDPDVADVDTGVLDGQVVVSSPAAGRDDAWSDGRVLAAFGAQFLAARTGVAPASLDFDEIVIPADEAFRRGASWAFAAAVQAERAARRTDAAGAPLAVSATLLVDLPAAPPPGIPVPAESVLEIEDGLVGFDARPVLPRGQIAAPIVATLLHETIDGPDDDPVDGTPAAFLTTLDAVLAGGVVYEDFHDRWVLDVGDPGGAFTQRAVEVGGMALEIDAFEPDDDPATAPSFPVWDQPAPSADGGVVVSEIFFGIADGVELTNTSADWVDVAGWRLEAARNGFGTGGARTVVLPAATRLGPGRSVLVIEGTPTAARSPHDAPAPGWSVPWAAGADGAVTLRDADGRAVDFVRWDGVQESTASVPSGTGFAGRLDAVQDERSVLARDALGTDTDGADDFAVRAPTPGWPDAGAPRVHTLRPRGDVDAWQLSADVELHVRRVRDEGVPELLGASVATTGPGIGRAATGSVLAVADSGAVRLRARPGAATSTGLVAFAWRPFTPSGLRAVDALRADVARAGALADTVRLRWSGGDAADSLLVFENGRRIVGLPPGATGVDLARSIGRYTYDVVPWQGGLLGASRTARVYVGPVECAVDVDFQSFVLFEDAQLGFTRDTSEPAALDGAVLVDGPVGRTTYAVADTATATFSWTVAVGAGTRARIEHAVHLAGDDDRALLQVSPDDGLVWETVASWDGTEFTGAESDADWTDGTLASQDFVTDLVDLSVFAGERLRVRLRRTSGASGTSLGWTIDRFAIESGGEDGVFVVAPDGSDELGCGTSGVPYATPAFALSRAGAGDRVELRTGIYDAVGESGSGGLSLPSGVTLAGAGVDDVVLRATAGTVAVLVSGDPVPTTVSGLRVEGGGLGLLSLGVPVVVDSVQIDGAGTAAWLSGTSGTFTATTFSRGATGVQLQGAVVDLEGCTLADLDRGVIATSAVDTVRITRSGFARIDQTMVQATVAGARVRLACSVAFDVASTFDGVTPELVDPLVFADPQHCDVAAGVYTLASASAWVDVAGCGTVGARGVGCTQTAPTDAPASARVTLRPPRPNPFNPRTEIAFDLPREGRVVLDVFDARGRRVVSLVDAPRAAGRHRVVWNGDDATGRRVGSGVYFVRLLAGGEVHTRRVALVR